MHNYGVVLAHSAKGSEWENHKYIRKKNGTYYYLDENGNETTTTHKDGSLKSNTTSTDKKDEKTSTDKKEDEKNVSAEAKKLIDSNIKAEDLTAENIEKLAKEVIRGGFGNGQERKDLLGEHYATIQKRVNELMKGYADTVTTKKKDSKETTSTKSSTKKTTKKSTKKKTNSKAKKKTLEADVVKHDGLYVGSTYIVHAGKGHDDNPPGRGSGRHPFGSGKRPYQHVRGGAMAAKLLTRDVKAGKDKPNTSLGEKAAKDTGNAIDSGKNAVKTYDRIAHRKDREEAYKKAYEDVKNMSDQEIRNIVNRKNLEKQYVDSLDINKLTKGEQRAMDILDVAGDVVGVVGGTLAIAATVYGIKHK